MRTEISELKPVKLYEYTCDVCGKKTRPAYSCTGCKKDLCVRCVSNWDGDGDYPEPYCAECWELGETYRKVRDKLEEKIYTEWKTWKDACKKVKE